MDELRSAFAPDDVRSFEEDAGMGRYVCAAVGLAVSRGGALRTDFGMDATGCEFNTSLFDLG